MNTSAPLHPFENTPEDFLRYVAVRARLVDEEKYRRDRQWKVFIWIASLLVAVIGGMVALNVNQQQLAFGHKILLSVAVAIFAFSSATWIDHDRSVAEFYTIRCWAMDSTFKVKFNHNASKWWHVSHLGFILLLAILTFLAIWIPVLGGSLCKP